jgi:sugar/nucleoside kinase (ribokinase family)
MKYGELIAIGGIYLDLNAPDFPISDDGLQLETEIVGNKYIAELGGSAVNFARLCAALEIPTTFIGKVGKDSMGQLVSRLLSEAGIKPSLIQSDEVQTNISFNMINPNGESIMAVVGSANQALSSDEVYERAFEKLEQSPYLFLGGCFKLKNLLPAYDKLVDDAKSAGTKVVIDHGRLNNNVTDSEKEIVREMALKADIYLPSRDEFIELWAVDSIEEGLQKFRQRSSAILVLKDGANGAVTIDDNSEIIRIASFSVSPIHTVGAGDSFNAGFISAQYKGMGLTESIRFACATGALKISQTKLPTYDEVINLAQI